MKLALERTARTPALPSRPISSSNQVRHLRLWARQRRTNASSASAAIAARSEEHTSELQSLMRSSYAVFCLKKKNTKQFKAPAPARHAHLLGETHSYIFITTSLM